MHHLLFEALSTCRCALPDMQCALMRTGPAGSACAAPPSPLRSAEQQQQTSMHCPFSIKTTYHQITGRHQPVHTRQGLACACRLAVVHSCLQRHAVMDWHQPCWGICTRRSTLHSSCLVFSPSDAAAAQKRLWQHSHCHEVATCLGVVDDAIDGDVLGYQRALLQLFHVLNPAASATYENSLPWRMPCAHHTLSLHQHPAEPTSTSQDNKCKPAGTTTAQAAYWHPAHHCTQLSFQIRGCAAA